MVLFAYLKAQVAYLVDHGTYLEVPQAVDVNPLVVNFVGPSQVNSEGPMVVLEAWEVDLELQEKFQGAALTLEALAGLRVHFY